MICVWHTHVDMWHECSVCGVWHVWCVYVWVLGVYVARVVCGTRVYVFAHGIYKRLLHMWHVYMWYM